MLKRKIFLTAILAIIIATCSLTLFGCAQTKNTMAQDSVPQDAISERVSFNKKYFYLGYDGIDQNQYYTINENGTATYNHVMKNGNTTTFHQEINFKWTYAGDGNCVLMHNGTRMIKGEQDDAFGISRVMHVSNDIIYWSASGENTYYICEDFVNQIPNYGKLI